jgi:phosphatidate cytidylyltransferase
LEAGHLSVWKNWGITSGLIFVSATWFLMIGKLSEPVLWGIFLLIILATLTRMLFEPNLQKGLSQALGTIIGIVYIPLLWSFVVRLFLSGDLSKPGWAAFYIILCMKMSDSGGYFFGSRFGKNKLAPTISPKKSWEGLLGGIVVCLAVNVLWVWISGGKLNRFIPLSMGHALTLGLLIPIVGTVGDLVESYIKRAVNMKDSNTMVYGLGGIFDMIDSILFAAPLLYLYIYLFIF